MLKIMVLSGMEPVGAISSPPIRMLVPWWDQAFSVSMTSWPSSAKDQARESFISEKAELWIKPLGRMVTKLYFPTFSGLPDQHFFHYDSDHITQLTVILLC
jgi:hypothetical protein